MGYNATNVVVAGEKFEIVDVDQRKKAPTAVEGSVLDGLDSSQRVDAEKYSLEELMDQKAKMVFFFHGDIRPSPDEAEISHLCS